MEENISSNRILRRLRAMEIINAKSVHALDMADLLVRDGVISPKQMEEIKTSNVKTELLFRAVELAAKDGKIDLLDYEWQLLPTHRITITMVTASGIKEFKFEEP